jgi:hypothetical protein
LRDSCFLDASVGWLQLSKRLGILVSLKVCASEYADTLAFSARVWLKSKDAMVMLSKLASGLSGGFLVWTEKASHPAVIDMKRSTGTNQIQYRLEAR